LVAKYIHKNPAILNNQHIGETMVEIGKRVPDFTLPATGDKSLSLKDFSGHNLVIYFYPKDNTTGCTREGLDFGSHFDAFQQLDCKILGVSRDSQRSHDNFRDKQDFPFDLLSDSDEKLCKLFDVIHEKSMYGRKFMGLVRSTFLIDKKGVLRRQWRKVKVAGHVEEVLESLQEIA
jgi:peroxiredoxin Q/BCP